MKDAFLGFLLLGAVVGFPSTMAHAQEATAWRCELGDHEGIDEGDARTAAKLVCAEVQRGGPAAGGVYQVGLGKLGSAVILTLDADVRGARDQRQMKLSGIEEVATAAPRISEALLRGKSVDQTERLGGLTNEETKNAKRKQGSMHFALGLFAVSPNMKSVAPGVDFTLHYETADFAIGAGARFAGKTQDSNKMMYDAMHIGGRYYLTSAEVSPFLGGGIAWTWLTGNGVESNNGIGAYAELGLEILRMHSAHLAAIARVDVPAYSLARSGGSSTSYYAPASLGMAFTF
ncbi:hypothetical protein LVJ94_47955 [Pendulispora rubella]|uniref:Uncharacterized protein n=1 Tax=Pendulispora rubella TaxID=2741070 RepID=A0ABZ2L5V8_9BACT